MQQIFKNVLFKSLKTILIVGSLLLSQQFIAQNQKLADSLILLYNQNSFQEKEELDILTNIVRNSGIPEQKLKYSEDLIQKATAIDNSSLLYTGYLEKNYALRFLGDFTGALAAAIKCANIAIKNKNKNDLGLAYTIIADIYSVMGNSNNAIAYYKISIKNLKDSKTTTDSINYGGAIENLGDEYLNLNKPDSALYYFKQSEYIFKKTNYEYGLIYNLGNTGLAYAQLGKSEIAEQKIKEATEKLTTLGDFYPICVYLTYMADIYLDKNDLRKALEFSKQSLHLALNHEYKDEISKAHLQLSQIYNKLGNVQKSFNHYKNHISYRDSLTNLASVQSMADLRTNFEVSQKQSEVDLLQKEAEIQSLTDKRQKIIIYATASVLVSIFIIAFGLYRRNNYINKTKIIIEEERNRSENLLHNILPEETAIELKQHGKVKAKKFDQVSVMFTDFVGFTAQAEKLSPEKLVESVDFYFSKFDTIIEKHGLEKIKTLGDAYMCAGGLPFESKDHAYKMVLAAFDIINFVEKVKQSNGSNQTRFDIRIGINTGPIVAGVVGIKKFAYDIWGDTVNVASRMESLSESGKINISENTYALVKNNFDCSYRGEIKVKNRGLMKMYFVNTNQAFQTPLKKKIGNTIRTS